MSFKFDTDSHNSQIDAKIAITLNLCEMGIQNPARYGAQAMKAIKELRHEAHCFEFHDDAGRSEIRPALSFREEA